MAERRSRGGRGAALPGLRRVRELRALTQVELATAAGITPAVVSRLEANPETKHADMATVRKLAAALGVSPSDLMSSP